MINDESAFQCGARFSPQTIRLVNNGAPNNSFNASGISLILIENLNQFADSSRRVNSSVRRPLDFARYKYMKDNNTYCSYHGEFINSRVVRGLPLAEAVYAPNLVLPKHSHPHACFCLILQGEYTESYGRTLLECKPLSVKFQPAGEVHSDLYGRDRVYSFIVELKSEWLTRTDAYGFVDDGPMVFRGNSMAWLMMRLRKEFHSADEEAPLAIEALMLELIATTSRNRKVILKENHLRWLQQAKEFLDDSFSQTVTLSAIAESVGVHPVYLAHSFRKHYQCSIGEYLRRRRVEFACHKISTSKDSLINIALAAGFSNQSHFSRIFKRVTGMSPSQYRAKSRPA
jgi:AraC family transcriptional regulator